MIDMPWEEKVWGRVKHLWTPKAMTSILEVNAGFRCSVHKHERRWNSFHVVSGKLRVFVGGEPEPRLLGGDHHMNVTSVQPGRYHRFEVIEPGTVVETYWTTDGSDVDMNDIVRLDEGGPI